MSRSATRIGCSSSTMTIRAPGLAETELIVATPAQTGSPAPRRSRQSRARRAPPQHASQCSARSPPLPSHAATPIHIDRTDRKSSRAQGPESPDPDRPPTTAQPTAIVPPPPSPPHRQENASPRYRADSPDSAPLLRHPMPAAGFRILLEAPPAAGPPDALPP